MQKLPKKLPTFAASFRCYIDRFPAKNSNPGFPTERLLTSQWMSSFGTWPKFSQDICPELAKAGILGFIACTLPTDIWGGRVDKKQHYGDVDYPVVHWYWEVHKALWQPSCCVKGLQEFADRVGVPVERLDGNSYD